MKQHRIIDHNKQSEECEPTLLTTAATPDKANSSTKLSLNSPMVWLDQAMRDSDSHYQVHKINKQQHIHVTA